MKALLHTTIGPVLAEARGHYIYIFTPEETYQQGLLNLWDYEKREMRIQPGLRALVQIVEEELTLYFERFRVLEISETEATLEEVMK